LVFDGRVTEDFKLSTGTWVSVGTLRPELVTACSPLIHDCVIAGQDREHIGVLVWPSPVAAQKYVAKKGPAGLAILARDIAERLAAFNAKAGGTSRKVGSMMLLTDPPSLDEGEITDKGYINQGAVLSKRAESVEDLYSGTGAPLLLKIP
jgi:feruloyl-CoA synthase